MSKPPKESDGKSGARDGGFPWSKGAADPRPIYRVVEMVRDADGRVRRKGNIWHVDLDVPRKFGRALAANTSSHRILIEDNQGRVLEEVPVISAGERKPTWTSWEDIPLPKLPPLPPPKRVPLLKPPAARLQLDEDDQDELIADKDCDVSL
ncbi:MAG TPA: hypothetical protein VLA16_26345 [Ideonella sp.]|nr:hypothetical protein [Ideonella sp.]